MLAVPLNKEEGSFIVIFLPLYCADSKEQLNGATRVYMYTKDKKLCVSVNQIVA